MQIWAEFGPLEAVVEAEPFEEREVLASPEVSRKLSPLPVVPNEFRLLASVSSIMCGTVSHDNRAASSSS